MNLKQFFYRDYYKDIELAKVEIPKEEGDDRKEAKLLKREIEAKNEPRFKQANKRLTDYVLKKAAANVLSVENWKGMKPIGYEKIVLATTYPGLFTGSGYNHETGNVGEVKLGFFFDHTTGLPILPGSSVKGSIRSVFPQFQGDRKDPLTPDLHRATDIQKSKADFISSLFPDLVIGSSTELKMIHQLELAIFEGVDFPATIKARAKAKAKKEKDADSIVCYLPMSKHDVFLEAFISKGGKGGHILGMDAITPHGNNPLKNPIPLPFLKILPEVEFTFQFFLHDAILDEQNKVSGRLKLEAFNEILITFGIGAKTNVGYGQFVPK